MTLALSRDDAGLVFDPHSGTWMLLSKAIHTEIEVLRDQMEQPNRLIAEHEFTRGRIAALREVLALAAPPTVDAAQSAGEDYLR